MSQWRTSSGFSETPQGFMVTSKPSEQWKKLTVGQKFLVCLYESGKLKASQSLCDLLNKKE